jgi:hypothetical protein
MNLADKLLFLARILYPKGRAFKMPSGGYLESLHIALSLSEERLYNDSLSTFNSLLPDNNNFTADDAADWERRLGIISNSSVPLSERKLAISQKMSEPTSDPRQSYLYLESQLQAAGFNVYVFENRFPDGSGGYVTKTPEELSGVSDNPIEHGDFQHGTNEHGGVWPDILANSIYSKDDADFGVGSDLRSTFFIGGNPVGTFADVDINRREEFRQLILRIKPVQTVGFLFINYI